MNALVIVDVQNDFCEGGSLAVEGGASVAARISSYVAQAHYDVVVATKDWHIDPGEHFATGEPDFVERWPVHCVADTEGAAFHRSLDVALIDAVFVKGQYEAAYSGFEAVHENSHQPLAAYLADRDVTEVDVAGLATDYCDKATSLDAVRLGFRVRLLRDLCAGVAPETTASAVEEMARAGVEIVDGSIGQT